MPQDHYVAQTYLRAHAYRKRGSGYFTPSPDALGLWLKIFEPQWASVVAKLAASHDLAADDKYVIAGYWAHLSTCTPTWRRVAADLQQRELDTMFSIHAAATAGT